MFQIQRNETKINDIFNYYIGLDNKLPLVSCTYLKLFICCDAIHALDLATIWPIEHTLSAILSCIDGNYSNTQFYYIVKSKEQVSSRFEFCILRYGNTF